MDSSTIFNVDSIYDGGIMMGLRQNDDGAITWGYGQHYVKYDIMGRRIWNVRSHTATTISAIRWMPLKTVTTSCA